MRTSRVVPLVVSALVASGIAALHPGPVAASTGDMHGCTTAQIQNGAVMRQISLTQRRFEITHAHRTRIPAHTAFDHAVVMEKSTVLGASIELSASVKADAGAFFAKASVEAGVKVAGNAQHTSTGTTSDIFHIRPAKQMRVYVFYDGNDYFTFRIHKRTCHMDGQKDYYGTLHSFNKVDEDGAVPCPHRRYKKNSIPYRVTLGAGC